MGVTLLLDTHVLLWLLGDPEKMPRQVRERLADPATTLLVSAVSAMEVATKTRLGKLPDVGLLSAWSRRIAEIGARPLDLSTAHALTAGSLAWDHRDPFDRLLAAQAIHEGTPLVTANRVFRERTDVPLLRW